MECVFSTSGIICAIDGAQLTKRKNMESRHIGPNKIKQDLRYLML
jgi:hypothetical protein